VSLRLGFEYVQTIKKTNEEGTLAINIFELTRERFFSGKSREVKIHNIKEYIDSISQNFSGHDSVKPFCVRN